MTTKIQELVDQRVKLIKDARDYVAECEKEGKGLTDEQNARFESLHDEADKLKAEIDQLEAEEKAAADRLARQEQAEAELEALKNRSDFDKLRGNLGKSKPGEEPQTSRMDAVNYALQGWANHGRRASEVDSQYAKYFKASGCSYDTQAGGLFIPLQGTAPNSVADIRAAQSTTSTEGGHTTEPGFVQNLERALLQFGGVRRVATILRTATGNALDWPTVNDTGNTGVLLGENTQDAEQDVTFGNLTLNAYKFSSRIVRISVELMQDSSFQMGSVLGSLLGERLGRIENTQFTTGSGSGEVNGIVTAASAGKTAASTTAITLDELLDLQASVDPAYRMGASWMFNDTTRNVLRKLKDGDSQYHWHVSTQSGEPDMLFNNPIVINQDMASGAASAKTVLYGDLSKYLVREVRGVTVVRMDERYADYHQVGFVAIARCDGDLLDAGTNPVKYLIQAAS